MTTRRIVALCRSVQVRRRGAYRGNRPSFIVLLLIAAGAVLGCIRQPEPAAVPSLKLFGEFSFEETRNSLDLCAPSVKTEGFVNTDAVYPDFSDPSAVYDRAKAEVDMDYDEYTVSYDPAEDIWMVQFRQIPGLTSWGGSKPYTKRTGNASKTVYLNGKGITLLIVSGRQKAG